jgi:hypothetical protein
MPRDTATKRTKVPSKSKAKVAGIGTKGLSKGTEEKIKGLNKNELQARVTELEG